MARLMIEVAKCPQNHVCPLIKICPVEALSQVGMQVPSVDYDKCIACGLCVQSCGKKALQIVE